jgi:hypothetical protein
MPILTTPRSLSEYERAMLRATLAFPGGPTPAVFTSENVRGLLGVDETCMMSAMRRRRAGSRRW